MRIGISGGPVPYTVDAVDERVAAKIQELGFTGVFAHFGYEPALEPQAVDKGRCRNASDIFRAFGIRVVQTWGWQPNLIDPDPTQRRQAVGVVREALGVAQSLSADGIMVGSGSLNPRGAFWPHPGNHDPVARSMLVESLREAAVTAEELGLLIALEGHVMTTLDSPEVVREVIESIGSAAVRVNLDPVNFVDRLETLYGSTALIDRVFDELGSYAVSGHVKDIYAEDRLVVHLSETVLGDGLFDLERYLMRFEEAIPDAYLIVEHLPEELVPRAKSTLDDLLSKLGVVPK